MILKQTKTERTRVRHRRLAAMVIALSALSPLALLADQNASPIRTSLPGFAPIKMQQSRLPDPNASKPILEKDSSFVTQPADVQNFVTRKKWIPNPTPTAETKFVTQPGQSMGMPALHAPVMQPEAPQPTTSLVASPPLPQLSEANSVSDETLAADSSGLPDLFAPPEQQNVAESIESTNLQPPKTHTPNSVAIDLPLTPLPKAKPQASEPPIRSSTSLVFDDAYLEALTKEHETAAKDAEEVALQPSRSTSTDETMSLDVPAPAVRSEVDESRPKRIAAVQPENKVIEHWRKTTGFDVRKFELSLRLSLHRGKFSAPVQPTNPSKTGKSAASPTRPSVGAAVDSVQRASSFLNDNSVLRQASYGDAPVPEERSWAETEFSIKRFEQSVSKTLREIDQMKTASHRSSSIKNADVSKRQSVLSDFDRPPLTSPEGKSFYEDVYDGQSKRTAEKSALNDFGTAIFKKKRDEPLEALPAAARLDRFGVKHYQSSPIGASFLNSQAQYGGDFSPTAVDPASLETRPDREAWIYDGKFDVPTQRPWIEWPRKFYGTGITPKGWNLWGEKNMYRPELYLYGDFRTAVLSGRNAAGRTDNWANRLNLDLDYWMTDTERWHMFFGPLDEGGRFTRVEKVNGDYKFEDEIDFTPTTGFFEGDLGVLLGAAHGRTSPFELPFTAGLVPLLFQNGIWMEDAASGFAFALPARHSRLLNISNMDMTFFAIFDQLNSPAFASASAAQAFGTAWFIEAYDGYIETGYAYLRDRNNDELSYHNATFSFTRRYFDRISNSVRVIVNTGQDLPKDQRTADGALLLVENSLITPAPLTVVPYMNFFVGWDRPQSVARVGSGVLRNTGINFDSDGLNGYATLDATGHDTAGYSMGIDLIGSNLDKQLVLEFSYLTNHGNKNPNVPNDQFAVGKRFQFPLSHSTLIRTDAMYGWRRGLEDVYGSRMEFRWKF